MHEDSGGQQLVGKWRSNPEDTEAIREYGDVTLDFSPTGGLIYTVHTEGKREIMLLTYRVEGDELITDQPSYPREERTRFEIGPCGELILFYPQRPSTYVRVDDNPILPLPPVTLN